MTGISRRHAISSLLAATAATATSIIALHAAQADAPGPGDKAPAAPGGTKPGANGLKAQFTPADREMNRKCINKTLSEAPNGKTWTWKNPKTGNGGTVTPTSPLQRQAGQTCRTFNESVTLKDGRSEQLSGRACKKADGSWEIVA
jgi:surface antigen